MILIESDGNSHMLLVSPLGDALARKLKLWGGGVNGLGSLSRDTKHAIT
jgi:hypothetical protein